MSQFEGRLPVDHVFTDEQLRAMVGKPVAGFANGRVVEAVQVGEELVLTMEVDGPAMTDLIRQLARECRTAGVSLEIPVRERPTDR